ncbi:outer membrane beta-barrel protein [uncultured Abyssibacter sp.]|uniref:outer membrane beta-barrel protein n=1 Tax=uncultured Abyssibacter sp. TaxID=2320202 RepID=UPI0032B1EB2A
MMKPLAAAALALLAATPALAESNNSIEFRLASGTYVLEDSFDEIELESAGIDLRGEFLIADQVFVRGELLSTTADEIELNGVDYDVDVDTTLLRFGLGYQGMLDTVVIYGAFEYGEAEFDIEDGGSSDDSGWIVSGGIRDNGENPFLWKVELGLVEFDDSDGAVFEFVVGYRVSEMVAIVLGGQSYEIEDDFGGEISIPNGSIGVQLRF